MKKTIFRKTSIGFVSVFGLVFVWMLSSTPANGEDPAQKKYHHVTQCNCQMGNSSTAGKKSYCDSLYSYTTCRTTCKCATTLCMSECNEVADPIPNGQ